MLSSAIVAGFGSTEEPSVIVLVFAKQDVQVVIPKHTLSTSRFDETLNEINNRWTIRATVCQIAYEDEPLLVRVRPIGSVTQMTHQRPECVDLSVDITHDVERAVEQGLN